MASRPLVQAEEDSVRNLLLGRANNENTDGNNKDGDSFVRTSVKAAMSAFHQTDPRNSRRQAELSEATVKHSETVYWLQLELNTTRQAKEALEDRMAQFYRDMQELENPRKPRSMPPDAAYVVQQQKQIDKNERMLKVLNNQIRLVCTSADALVENLKDEIKDLMEDKAQNELQLMNMLSALDKEKRDLEQQLAEEKQKNSSNFQYQSIQTGQADDLLRLMPVKQPSLVEEEPGEHSESPTAPASFSIRETTPPKPPCRHKSIEYDDPTPLRSPRRQKSADDDIETMIELLEDDLKRLRVENKELREELQSQKADEIMISETDKLSAQVEELKTKNKSLEWKLIEARNEAHERFVQWTREKASLEEQLDNVHKSEAANGVQVMEAHQTSLEALDRVALLWDSANESIRSLESTILEVRPNPSQDAERTLSVLETTSLVNEQIKASLMLIELQFRNSLRCLDHDHLATQAVAVNGDSKALHDKVKKTQDEAMESIGKVGTFVDEQIQALRIKFEEESLALHEMHEAKSVDLRQLLDRQAELEKEIIRLQSEKNANIKADPSAVEMLVSQKAMETLQSEVLLIVERVKEKNETIGRLSAEIEEHKVRERTLMHELKRHMKDQADRQMAEQQRLMEQHARYESSESEGASTSSEYDEKTVEETVYDEITIND